MRFALSVDHPLEGGYDVVCCQQCGFVFADTAVTQSVYDAFYARMSKYEDQQTATGGGDTPWDAERLQYTATDLSRFLQHKTARILDIGCANGGLLQALQRLGYANVHGIDPAPACVRNAQARGLAVSTGSLFALPDGLEAADCVILSHVLEHVQELRSALHRLPEILRPGGVLYVEVPDASRYTELLTAPFQDFNTEHINHFSPLGLRNLLEPAGWQVQTLQQKTILSAPRMPYPAVFAVARCAAPVLWQQDRELRRHIGDYIQRSQALLDRIDRKIRRALPPGGGVIVWGTGQLAMKLLLETALRDARVIAFVDGNPINHGRTLAGVPILAPEQLRGRSEPIFITTIIHQQAVLNAIREKHKLTNPIILLGN
jgi:ubiquinone/menaquinone biosynthesis C-methylase UbiE